MSDLRPVVLLGRLNWVAASRENTTKVHAWTIVAGSTPARYRRACCRTGRGVVLEQLATVDTPPHLHNKQRCRHAACNGWFTRWKNRRP